MKKKVVSVLLVGAMAGTMLAGCGGDNKAADAGDNTKKEDTADKSDSSDDSSAEGKVTLNVTTTFAGTESNVDKYQETIENWQKETGNKVNDSSASADEAMKPVLSQTLRQVQNRTLCSTSTAMTLIRL